MTATENTLEENSLTEQEHQFNVELDSLLVDGEAGHRAVGGAGGSSQDFPAGGKTLHMSTQKNSVITVHTHLHLSVNFVCNRNLRILCIRTHGWIMRQWASGHRHAKHYIIFPTLQQDTQTL